MVMTQMRRAWTDEEKSMAQKYPPAQIASEIGRALASVRTKAQELHISLRMDRGDKEPGTSGLGAGPSTSVLDR
jgi:hypothetical protein